MKNNDINFESAEEFVSHIVERVKGNGEPFVEILARFEEAKEILKEIMFYEDVNFESIEIHSPEMQGYADEFCLSLWDNDGVIEVCCEPAKRDGEYFDFCGDITYVFDNCSSKIMPLCKGAEVYFVSIDEFEGCDCDGECDECCPCDCHCDDSCVEYSKTDDGELHGFTASKSTDNGYHSYSFYTSDNLSKNDIRDLLKEFGF